MAFIISGGGGSPVSVAKTFSVVYTALGGETDFFITLPVTMADLNYAIAWSFAGGASGGDSEQSSGVQGLDLPKANRTATQFRVVPSAALTTGDVIEFTISGNVAIS